MTIRTIHTSVAPKKPYISAKEPYISAKEPDISAKEPCISAKEPYKIWTHIDEGVLWDGNDV